MAAADNKGKTRVARREQELNTNKKGKTGKPTKKKLFKRIFLSLIGLFVVGVIASVGLFFYYAKDSPKITSSSLESTPASVIYAKNDEVITTLGTSRVYAESSDIPQTLKDAIVSIEDKRFYKHNGVDPVRIAGAALANVTGGSAGLQGGSTLTQQLIKLSVFSTKASDQTMKRKAQEAWLALQVERKYSKSQILTFYANKVFMGNGVYGMQTASNYYFGKKLDKLNIAQIAMLAGIPNAPSSYNPYAHPKYSKERRDEVIDAMVSNDKISASDASTAKATPITSGLRTSHSAEKDTYNAKISDSYLKEVIQTVKDKGLDPYNSSLKIHTNLDLDAQKRLYDIANTDDYVNYPDDKMQLAVTMVDSKTGAISAMIGGRKQTNVTFGYNRAVATSRSNGSTMKPIMDFAPAIEYLNYPTNQKVNDTKYYYPDASTKELNDFDHGHLGTMTMRSALVQSRNIPAIRTLEAVGLPQAQTFVKKLGISKDQVETYSSGIGGNISTTQNAEAYAAFANGGTYRKGSYISDIVKKDGTVLNYSSSGSRAMKISTAYMITDMLKGVIDSPSGTGTAAQIPGLYQAGKTGTTDYPSNVASKFPSNAAMDSLFSGYTKNYSISVWTGYDSPLVANNYLDVTSQHLATGIYKNLMQYVSQSVSNSDWTKPSDVYLNHGELSLTDSSTDTTTSNDSSYDIPEMSSTESSSSRTSSSSEKASSSSSESTSSSSSAVSSSSSSKEESSTPPAESSSKTESASN
ncbi:transglycosylase domain-containing protein [Dellaglioa algida]|uniref:transglycosylase domain-containing protein n=1 Tax=Dellaglioa algida TaxID=105612 RepID=UPI000BCDD7F0|nr:PBP1A family penicillin-binding protein [Dellaglioa algida]MDK1717990.1 PBP1A family penicillin-binding protein [Dellaglioa algida]MDK1729241.1 PBP1A family penicillin-binding protein [Dellaglioa algida]MDK1741675.1 PBP1A family penicillin-binding protein [Dellaglioa algida]SOB49540.1 Penicillin-binding protein 1A [Dellaglioa algida]